MPSFVESFITHLDVTQTQVSDLATRTGVSRTKLYALKERKAKSTTVEDAMKIARYFGKTVEEFCNMPPQPQTLRLNELFNELEPDEAELAEAQLEALLQIRRARQK